VLFLAILCFPIKPVGLAKEYNHEPK
jgi:hypothetical protein